MKQKVTKDNWEALIHWNFALVGGFLGAYAIYYIWETLVRHRPEISWKWQRRWYRVSGTMCCYGSLHYRFLVEEW